LKCEPSRNSYSRATSARLRVVHAWNSSLICSQTATIAAYFAEQKAEEDVAIRLDQIMERLDRIEGGLQPGEDQHARELLRR
jgi:hypothetical protein